MSRNVVTHRALVALGIFVVLLGPAGIVGFANPGGPPAGFTNAPGELNCTACHTTYALNSGAATFGITAPLFVTPNVTQLIGVGFGNSTTPRHGFQITARSGAGVALGSWQSIGTGLTKNAAGGDHHVQTSAGSHFTSWVMQWLASTPIQNGPIIFYSCGVEGIDDDQPENDWVYSATATMFQAVLTTPSAAWPIGTTQTLTLDAPTHGGQVYAIVPSESAMPYPLGGPFVLQVDPTTGLFDLAQQLPSVFQNIIGNLNAAGQATAAVSIPYEPVLIGFTLHFAAGTGDAQLNPTEVSNRVTVTLQ